MPIGKDEALPGGVEPQFVCEVSAVGASCRRTTAASSSDELTSALHDAATHRSAVTAVLIGTAVAACVALMVEPWLVLVAGVAGIVLLVRLHARDAARSRVVVRYELDAAGEKADDSLNNGAGWLANSNAVWRVTGEGYRVGASVTRDEVANLVTNVTVPAIFAANETLLFLPHALLVRDSAANFFDVSYSTIGVTLTTVRHSEPDGAPRDSDHVGSAWLYANKDGSPDRRRANNRQIPIVEYGRVELTWRRSNYVLLVSNVSVAKHFVSGLQAMTQLHAPKRAEVTMPMQPITGLTDLERALKASLEQKLRLQELEREVAARRVETPPPASPAPTTPGVWIAQGGSANVHGFATGDFVYVGNRLTALNGRMPEPALIDPALPVDPAYANTTGAGMAYWPSYARTSAAGRRAYLQWLAGGRKDPHAYIGYVFLFFYGLERRIYELIQNHAPDGDEMVAIAREVARLLELYGRGSSSFESYATDFLDFIAMAEPRASRFSKAASRHEFGPSQQLKLALGELALAGKSIPARLALEWVRSTYSLNTPATRCAEEFELLFHIRYAKKFGDGMLIPPNKQFIDITYRPASNGVDTMSMTHRRIPDLTKLTRPLTKFFELTQECCSALDPFSRFLGKNESGRESLAAFGLLPEELVEATPSSDASSLAELVRSRFDNDGYAHLGAAELLHYVRLAKPEKVAKNEAMLLAQALEKLGYGIEPDVRVGGPVYDAEGRVVVFRRLPDCPSNASDEYATATLCMRLGATVSAADDDVSEDERALLQKHISETLQLSPGERQRLAAHLGWLLAEKPGIGGLKKQIAALSSDARHHIGQLLITVAASDGRVDPREMKMLEKLYDLIGLKSGDLYADIHAALAGDDEPIDVASPAATSKGFAIPPKPSPPATTAAGIDMERVRLKIAETRQVSSLLSSIFVDEEPIAAAAKIAIRRHNTIGTLDAAHSELLRRLVQRESWPRDEVERLASELSLMPDGALETINDYAYATANDALWEDDDPVAINPNVARELTT